MAYYNKKEVLAYAESENKKAEDRKLSPLTPIEKTIEQLDTESEIVGFFWVNITEGEKMNLEGKTFVRIDFNLYTDDRFAIDLLQAQNDEKTVSEIIKERAVEQEDAKSKIDDKTDVEKEIKDTVKRKEK